MNIDFSSIDKSDFKCLKASDGSVYYGQLIQAYFGEKPPAKMSGFQQANLSKKASQATNKSMNSQATSPKSSAEIQTVGPWIVDNINEVDEEIQPMIKTVRHGSGIQFYEGHDAKYAGEWCYDERHGDGSQTFPDGSEYQGNFEKGVFNGYGIFKWPSSGAGQTGHTYQGEWKMGQMHGEGEFVHADGHVLRSTFLNNLWLDEAQFINPFLNSQEKVDFKARIQRSKDEEAAQALENKQKVNLFKANDNVAFRQALYQVWENGRTPLVVSSFQNPIDSEEMISMVQPISLRYLREDASAVQSNGFNAHELREEYDSAMQHQTSWSLAVILDEDCDNQNKWLHKYDPDIQTYFRKGGLPQRVWCAHDIFKSVDEAAEDIKEHLHDFYSQKWEEFQVEQQQMEDEEDQANMDLIAPDEQEVKEAHLDTIKESILHEMSLYSKTKFDAGKSDEEVLADFKKRFACWLPMEHIDCIFVHSLEDPVVEESAHEEDDQQQEAE